MKIVTDYAGEVTFNEEQIIKMPKGFYGFPDSVEFVLIGEMTVEFPFVWLQSISEEDVCFILTDPFLFVEDYNFEIDDEVTEKLNIKSVEDVQVFTTVVINRNIEESTINLKSPIIINQNDRLAEQVVIDADYPYKRKLFKDKAVM
ncbi:MAG: flagellar assembly protein FliW [Clostridiales bacterium]|nr:MAG: flagellar assembly protein FliW [Clostridiales bacterium]